jgi:hypothetical protein
MLAFAAKVMLAGSLKLLPAAGLVRLTAGNGPATVTVAAADVVTAPPSSVALAVSV